MKLFDSELKILDVLWEEGDTTAKQIARTLNKKTGWSKTTTYTVIKKCIDKGAVSRDEPDFICHAMVSREEVQETETSELINKMYKGMPDKLVAAILGQNKLSQDEIKKLKSLIRKLS